MFPNLLLGPAEMRQLDDQRRRDLAAMWGRPRVPHEFAARRRGVRRLRLLGRGRRAGRRSAPPVGPAEVARAG